MTVHCSDLRCLCLRLVYVCAYEKVSDQGRAVRASDHHSTLASILDPLTYYTLGNLNEILDM